MSVADFQQFGKLLPQTPLEVSVVLLRNFPRKWEKLVLPQLVACEESSPA